MSSSAKRACAIPPPVFRILTQPDSGVGTVPLPVPEDAMEVDFDAGVEPVLVRKVQRKPVRCGKNVPIKPTWKYDQTLQVSAATVTQFKTELQSSARQRPTKPRERRNSARVVTLEYADAMCAPEHCASTPHTRALRSLISRMMSKWLESCDTLSAFFHAWLERGVWVKPPKW